MLEGHDLRIPEVEPTFPSRNDEVLETRPEMGRNRRRRRPREENKDHFEELANEAELANEMLIREDAPYRFCIHRDGDQILIDIVTLDEEGNIATLVQKDITHQDFRLWAQHIGDEEGLVFDLRI